MRGYLAFAALAVVSCASASGADSATHSDQAIEADNAAQMVITPFGKVNRACFHAASEGADESLAVDESVSDASCAPPIKPDTDAEPAGWVAWADEDLASGVSFLQADFTVPPVPKEVGDQVIFLFPSLTPTINPPIIQPVLQFGAAANGGGKYWSSASWYLNKSANSWTSKLVKVSAGDKLRGTISGTGTCSKGTCTTWTITLADLTQPKLTTTLTEKGAGTHYVQLQGAALETYQIDSCSQYPSAGVAFTNILVKDNSGKALTPAWKLFTNTSKSDNTQCGFTAASPTPGEIDLGYTSTL